MLPVWNSFSSPPVILTLSLFNLSFNSTHNHEPLVLATYVFFPQSINHLQHIICLPVPFGTNLNEKNEGLWEKNLSVSGKLFYYLRAALETKIHFPFSRIWPLCVRELQHLWKYDELLNVENMTYCFGYYFLSRMMLQSLLQYISDQWHSKEEKLQPAMIHASHNSVSFFLDYLNYRASMLQTLAFVQRHYSNKIFSDI